MKQIGYVFNTKHGNEIFVIGNKTYIIAKRPTDRIGENGNFAEKILLEIKKNKSK